MRTTTAPTETITSVAIEAIEASPFQYRRAMSAEELDGLVASVREHGILQPVLVRAVQGKQHAGIHFQVVAGHRRWEAARRVGMTKLPAIVKVLTDLHAAEIALIENVQREDPEDWSTAIGIRSLMEMFAEQGEPLSEAKLARRIHRSVTYVRNHLGLFNLHPRLQEVAQRHREVRSSLFEIQKVASTSHLDALIEAVDSGASYKTIKAHVEHINAEEENKKESRRAPDRHTGTRTAAQAQSGGGQMSRGRQVTGNQAAQARDEVRRHLAGLEAWLPLLTDADYDKYIATFASRIARGDYKARKRNDDRTP